MEEEEDQLLTVPLNFKSQKQQKLFQMGAAFVISNFKSQKHDPFGTTSAHAGSLLDFAALHTATPWS